MANPARGELTLHIGDQTRDFSWEIPQILVIEDVLKMGIASALSGEHLGIKTICVALMAGYLDQDRKMTPGRVAQWLKKPIQHKQADGSMVDIDVGDLLLIIVERLNAAMPAVKKPVKEPENKSEDPSTAPSTTSSGA